MVCMPHGVHAYMFQIANICEEMANLEWSALKNIKGAPKARTENFWIC